MNDITQLKKKIMRRVYLAFFLRRMASPLAVKSYMLVAFLGFLVSQVSVSNVAANMPRVTDIAALYRFSLGAFLNTEFIVQLLSVGIVLAMFLLLKDMAKMHLAPHLVSA